MGDLNDSSLIQDILKGNKVSFTRLVQRYWDMVYHLCYQRLGNPADAEDTAQESFIKVYKYLSQLRDKSKFAQWFYSLILQLCNERRRKQKTLSVQITPELEDKAHQTNNNDPRKDSVIKAIRSLPDDFRLVITLRFYKDMSCAQIATHLGEPVGTVTSRVHRAYKVLRNRLAKE